MLNVLFVCIHNAGRSQMAAALVSHRDHRVRAEILRLAGGARARHQHHRLRQRLRATLRNLAQNTFGIACCDRDDVRALLQRDIHEWIDRLVAEREVDAEGQPRQCLETLDIRPHFLRRLEAGHANLAKPARLRDGSRQAGEREVRQPALDDGIADAK